MNHETRLELLERIAEIQNDSGVVSVQIGHVSDSSGIVKNNSITLTNAPATFINTLRDEGWSISVTDDGARIHDRHDR